NDHHASIGWLRYNIRLRPKLVKQTELALCNRQVTQHYLQPPFREKASTRSETVVDDICSPTVVARLYLKLYSNVANAQATQTAAATIRIRLRCHRDRFRTRLAAKVSPRDGNGLRKRSSYSLIDPDASR